MTAEPQLPTRRLAPGVVDVIKGLTPGDRIRVTQTVRVGARTWPVPAVGVFSGLNYLATGITTERVAEDDIVVPLLHFTKDNGELSTISLDENTKVERL